MSTNLTDTADKIMPLMINIFSTIGLTVFLSSIFISIYCFVKKGKNWKEILWKGSLGGIVILVGALLTNITMNYDPFSSVQVSALTALSFAIIALGSYAAVLYQYASTKSKEQKSELEDLHSQADAIIYDSVDDVNNPDK